MIEATTVRAKDAYLQPGKAMRDFGYGYLFWLLPGNRRQFALVGAFGQRIVVDPPSKLVMVQTALDETDAGSWKLWRTLVAQLG
jgi:CubicO group peptidase (beta-lactamase class C family)